MGRRELLEHSHKKPGSLASETTEDTITNIAASEGSFGEPHNSLRTAVPLRKPWSSSAAEHGHHSGAMQSPSARSASASNSSSDVVSQPSTRDSRSSSLSSQIDRWDSTAKSLFSSTGRALRKHASKLSLAPSISYDKDEDGKVVWKLSGLGADDQDSIHSLSSARRDILKRAISAPFNFKHVTHTYQEQVRGLERASRNELISEFSAIRAGQRADPQLRGIKAESLLTPAAPLSPDKIEAHSETPETKAADDAPPAAQPPLSPKGSSMTSSAPSSRAVENFSRPVSRMSQSPISPPKRISSLNACVVAPVRLARDALSASDNTNDGPSYPRRLPRPAINPALSPVVFKIPSQDMDVIAVGHAISTADGSARPLKALPLPMPPVDLEDVPEDEEDFVHGETGTRAVTNDPKSLPLRHAQSFPSRRPDDGHTGLVTAHLANRQRHTTALDEGFTQLSLKGSPRSEPEPPRQQTGRDTNRFSIGLKPMCETQHWEDDVDYCYEHAAEAESYFDWDQPVANLAVGLEPAVFDATDPVDHSLGQLQQLTGPRKHDSQESSILSIAESIVDISASTHSIGSLPELDYSVNSSRESMDWETSPKTKRHSRRARQSQRSSPSKIVKPRQGLGLSYSLFPSPPRTP